MKEKIVGFLVTGIIVAVFRHEGTTAWNSETGWLLIGARNRFPHRSGVECLKSPKVVVEFVEKIYVVREEYHYSL